MSNLNQDDITKDLDRYVLEVLPKESDFEVCFRRGLLSPMAIDKNSEMNLPEMAKLLDAAYYDLSKPRVYDLFAKSLLRHPDGVIFDHIDRIPATQDGEYIRELVRFALKQEEDFPIPGNDTIHFSDLKVGVRCATYPDYLEGKSLQTLVIEV